MKPYWYWPFSREEYLPLAREVAGRPEIEQLTVSTIDRPGAWPTSDGRLRVAHDLAGVRPVTGVRRLVDRPAVYLQRTVARRKAAKAAAPDLVHVWFSNQWSDAVDLRVRQGRPTLLHVHDVWPHERRLPDRLTKALLSAVYAAPDVLVTYHESLRDALVADFGVDPGRIHVIPHVVPPPVVDPAPGDGKGEAGDELVVLFFGTLRRNKGLRTLLAAIDELGPDAGVRWVLAGKGDPGMEALALEAAATRPHIEARMAWHSAEEKSRLYHRADLVVLPYTRFASQSGVLHDAYGHGRPVIVSDVGALGDTVRDDGTGWVVTPRDPVELAKAVGVAAGDRASLRERGAVAKAEAERRSPAVVADRLVEVYRQVLGQA